MNDYQEDMRMTPRRKYRAHIIVACFSLVVLLFVIHQTLFNSNIWRKLVEMDESPNAFLDGQESEEVSSKILTHRESYPFHGEKLIHLDLKGAPPKVSYFKKFFPYIKKLGATGVLIEYEDMFFYRDELEDIRAMNAYTPEEIKEILSLAQENDLQVIPLIQTFGHFEFVLKLDKFRDMREVDEIPQALCPSHDRAQSVIQKMIDQVLNAHPKAKYIHLGGDEVLYLGKCDKCQTVMEENDWSKYDLFLNHVKSIAMYVNKTYSGVRPILWGDMFATISRYRLQASQISSLLDVMVWKYVPNVSEYITESMLSVYADIFKNIWIASAFKGATGVTQVVTNAKYHLANQMGWMDIVSKWKKVINFKGIALTGWQRYDHFSTLCELLPVAVPSLALSLQYLSDPQIEFTQKVIKKILWCQPPFSVNPVKNSRTGTYECDFPGFRIFELVNKFSLLSTKMQDHLSVKSSGWFSTYNIVNKFSNPAYVRDTFSGWPTEEYLHDLKILEEELTAVLSEVYDEHTVREWMLTYLVPLRLRLEAFTRAKEELLSQETWPRRPLLNHSDDLDRAAKEICTSDRKFGCALLML